MENKTGKYFKYAIGEIILVVIGILIALQINNWNEEQKIDKVRNSKLQQIEADLRSDILNLEHSIKIKDNEIKSLESLSQRFNNPDFTIDSLVKFVNSEFKGRASTGLSGFNNTTYNSLVQSGDIGILDDDLVKDLSNLNTEQQNSIKSRNDHFNIYLEKIQKFNAEFPSEQSSRLFGAGPLANLLNETRDDKRFITSFNEVLIARALLYSVLQNYHQNTLKMTQDILNTYFIDND